MFCFDERASSEQPVKTPSKRRHLLVLIALAFALVLPYPTRAQRITASLIGTVHDSSGGVLPGAIVMVENTSSAAVARATSSSDGQFIVNNLIPGPYKVTVDLHGYKQLIRQGITLDVDQTAQVNLTLEVGSVSESVVVTAAEPLLETQTSDVGEVIENKSIENLPLNQRNPFSLILLVPGVTGTVGSDSYGQTFNVNGGRSGSTDVLIDGIPSTPPTDGYNALTIFPSVDATQEFKVQTSNYSAQFGMSGGGIINVLYKSGTNDFHGSAFEFYRNSVLDANNYFSNFNNVPLPEFNRHQFGFSLGGPVLIPKLFNGHNRSFFFADYEGLRQLSNSTTTATVPTLAERGGDFSGDLTSTGSVIKIYDPATNVTSGSTTTRTQFPGNKINPSRFDPVSKNVLKYIPLPNTAGINGRNNFFASGVSPYTINQWDVKFDQVLSPRHRFFIRYSARDAVKSYANFFPADIAIAQNANTNYQPAIGGAFDYVFAKSSTYALEVRYGVNHIYNRFTTPSDGFDPVALGFPAYLTQAALATSSSSLDFPGFEISNYLGIGAGSQTSKGQYGLLTETWMLNNVKVLGRHLLNFGGEFRILMNNTNQVGRSTGDYSFSAGITQGPNAKTASSTAGDGFASLLLGFGSGTVTHNFKIVNTLSHYYAGYIQDDWRATDKLTLNMGLRYDFYAPRTERQNRMSYLDFDAISPLSATTGLNLKGGLEYVGVNGNSRSTQYPETRNFAPRFGLAYHPFQPFVIRAAAGIFYANNPNQAASTIQPTGYRTDTSWFGVSDVDNVSRGNPLSDPFPGASFIPITGNTQGLFTSTGRTISGNLRRQPTPYTENWNLGVEYQLPSQWLVGVSYVGNHGLQLPAFPSFNQVPSSYLSTPSQLTASVTNPFFGKVAVGTIGSPYASKTIQKRYLLTPFPQFTGISGYQIAGSISHYNSVQVKIKKNVTRNATVLVSYTGAKSMDDYSINNSNFGTNGVYQDASIPLMKDSYSLSTFDVSRILVASGVYYLPFGKGARWGSHWNGITNALLGGYRINGIFTAQTGLPLAFSASNVANLFNPGERPNWNGLDPRLGGRIEDKLTKYFNTADFTQPATYTLGNMSRTHPYLRSPGSHNVDISLLKDFKVYETLNAQFRAEAFNAFNTPAFGQPDVGVTSSTFGQIKSQSNSPRQLQFALKLLF